MIQRNKLIKISLLLAIFFLITAGITLLRISYLPFGSIKNKIDTFSSSGNASLFTEAIFKQIVIKLRFVGFTFLIISGLLYIIRQHIQKYILNILTSCILFLRGIKQQFDEVLKKEDKIHLYAIFVILLLSVVVRLFFLFQPMRYDEAATFTHYASKPLYYGLSSYTFPNNHIFHTFWVHVAYLLLGNKPWVIRLPAFIAGILIVPASYIVIRLFYNKYAALLTAGLVASSSLLIEYSTNARGYTMICLFFLLILSLAKYLKNSENSFAWLLFAAISAMGFHTIPIMLYPFGIVVTWLLLSIIFRDANLSRSLLLKKLSLTLIITCLFISILYLSVLITSGLRSVMANKFTVSQSMYLFVTQFSDSMHFVWNQWNRDIPLIVNIIFVIGFFISVTFHKRLATHQVPIILATLVYLVPILLAQRVVPPNRVWLFLLPIYIGLASSGIVYILRGIERIVGNFRPDVFAIVCVAILLLLSLNVMRTQSVYNSEETGTFRDAEQVAIFLKDYLRGGDRVLSTSEAPLEYYFNLHRISVKYLHSDLNSSQRILAIVNESSKQNLKGFLNSSGLSISNSDNVEVIKQYEFTAIYELKK